MVYSPAVMLTPANQSDNRDITPVFNVKGTCQAKTAMGIRATISQRKWKRWKYSQYHWISYAQVYTLVMRLLVGFRILCFSMAILDDTWSLSLRRKEVREISLPCCVCRGDTVPYGWVLDLNICSLIFRCGAPLVNLLLVFPVYYWYWHLYPT